MTTELHDPYETIIDDLAYSYEGVFSRDDVAGTVTAARHALGAAATITQFLPVLVAKQAASVAVISPSKRVAMVVLRELG